MVVVFIVALFAGVYWRDYRALLRQKKDAVFYLNTVLIVLSFTVMLLTELHVTLPSPIEPITYLLRDVLKLR